MDYKLDFSVYEVDDIQQLPDELRFDEEWEDMQRLNNLMDSLEKWDDAYRDYVVARFHYSICMRELSRAHAITTAE